MRDHRLIDERSLAFASAIAEQLRRDPTLIAFGKQNLERWMATCSPHTMSALDEWNRILDGPFESIIERLTATDERAMQMRQSNPFAGLLPMKVRNKILLEFEARDKAAT